MGSKVNKTVVNKIRRVRYSALKLICTADAGRFEQMTLIVGTLIQGRCVEENFVEFIAVLGKTAGPALGHSLERSAMSRSLYKCLS
jgi:hypothetical protein